MMRLLLIIALLTAPLGAQALDRERTRFLCEPHGRPGAYAPLEVVFNAPGAGGVALVQVQSPGVVLRKQVALAAAGPTTVRMPCRVGADSTVSVDIAGKVDSFSPAMPSRPAAPGYHRVFVAVFTPDAALAAPLLDEKFLLCTVYRMDECFSDWRMLAGYDAVVVLNPGEGRLPPGAPRALAEFASLGGAIFAAGDLTFGGNVPAPPEPQTFDFAGVIVMRQSYGAGTLYRVAHERLDTGKPGNVVAAALRRHHWYGAGEAPAGAPVMRGGENPPVSDYIQPGERRPAEASLMVYALGGLLALVCLLAPLASLRVRRELWPGMAVIVLIAVGAAAAGSSQAGPVPQVQASVLELASEAPDVAARREMWLVPPALKGDFVVDLDASRILPHLTRPRGEWRVWMVDVPLTSKVMPREMVATFEAAYIEGLPFRDFAARSRLGETALDETGARVLDWWLEINAYRGRSAQIVKLPGVIEPTAHWPGSQTVINGGVSIIEPR